MNIPPAPKQWRVFLTGVTGTIGSRLASILLSDPGIRLTVLGRGKGRTDAPTRLRRVLEQEGYEWNSTERLTLVSGNVSEPWLGLPEATYRQLATESDLIIHSAANTRLSESEEKCRKANLTGTEQMLHLAWEAKRCGSLMRFCHVSTAYVAGNLIQEPLVEDRLPQNPIFSNHYERSKYAAEVRVREEMGQGLPVTVFRPSIIVGDSVSGRPGAFNVFYPFCRLLASGALRKFPIDMGGTMNIVPVDFVAHALAAIAMSPRSLGKTYHLVSKHPTPMQWILDLQHCYPEFAHLFRRTQTVSPKDFDPRELSADEKAIFEGLSHYLPYLQSHLDFDTSNMDAIMPDLNLHWPDTGMPFLRKLFEYVVAVGYISTD